MRFVYSKIISRFLFVKPQMPRFLRASAKIRIPSERMPPAEHLQRIVKYSGAMAKIDPGYAEQQQTALAHIDAAQYALDLVFEELCAASCATTCAICCCRRTRAHSIPEIRSSDAAITADPLGIAAYVGRMLPGRSAGECRGRRCVSSSVVATNRVCRACVHCFA